MLGTPGLTGRDKGQCDGKPVHFRVEGIRRVVVVNVLGDAAVDVPDRRVAVADADSGLNTVDPDTDNIVELGRVIFGVFFGTEHEIDGDRVAVGRKIDLKERGVKGVGRWPAR